MLTILFSLCDADGELIHKNHPFVDYLESKIGYYATTNNSLPMFWKYMPSYNKSRYSYRSTNITIEDIKDVHIHSLLESNGINIADAQFFKCFKINKLDYQVACRCKFTHNSCWIQFVSPHGDNVFCRKLQDAFHVGDQFKIIVESSEIEFIGHRL
jgi:hypothetical protein